MLRSLIIATLLALSAFAPMRGEPDAKAIDEMMLRWTANGWSGAVLIEKDGKEFFAGGYGFADLGAGRANDADTLFEIASISKSFTGTAVVKLAQQGKLALDDSIALRLPDVPEHSRGITVRHLLTHTSGIPPKNGTGRGDDLAKAVKQFLGNGPEVPPGTKYEYSNGGYALLAGVIERASGLSYTQYLEQELFAPAGMSDTGFTGDTDLDAARAAIGAAHDGNDRGALEHPYGAYGYQYRGMGGVVTTARDLLKWDRAFAKHVLLDAAHEKELFTPALKEYALGWRVTRAVDGGVRQYHGGSVRGFVSEFRRYPAENACIAVLCNRDDQNCGELSDHLECLLLGRPLLTPAPKAEFLRRGQGELLAGTYACASGKLVVKAAPGVLVASIEGEQLSAALGAKQPSARLEPRGKNTFGLALGKEAVPVEFELVRGKPSAVRIAGTRLLRE